MAHALRRLHFFIRVISLYTSAKTRSDTTPSAVTGVYGLARRRMARGRLCRLRWCYCFTHYSATTARVGVTVDQTRQCGRFSEVGVRVYIRSKLYCTY